MKGLFVYCVILFALFQCCSMQRRIMNGVKAEPNSFPYMAIIYAASVSCGGALLNEEFVLTAAHCLMELFKDEKFNVILGAHKYYDKGEPGRLKLNAVKYWTHENFSMPTAVNDIAIIKLPTKVKFTEKIQPIKIANSFDENENVAVVLLSGWGKPHTDAYYQSDFLRTTIMKVIPLETCMKFAKNYDESITENNICAIGNMTSPCDGDSGSPLITQQGKEIIAITSFVKDAEDGKPLRNNECDGSTPSVYTRVTPYLNWIAEKTGMQFD